MIGFTALLSVGKPVLIFGSVSVIMLGLTVSALGIRLNALSNENGHISLIATMLQRSTAVHLGAFLRRDLRTSTATITTLAEILC